MPRLSFKPDASFFKKISIGAVGARAVINDLARYGHKIVELERGSTDTKLWKDVKRKRVRIPDLVCLHCGLRIESRAKTKASLSMSHSPLDDSRAWDYGMVDSDIVAFPICKANEESYWNVGRLNLGESYWHEKNWVKWKAKGAINYFKVGNFRSESPSSSNMKGVTEGSETSVLWKATFSTRSGIVQSIAGNRIKICRDSDGHNHTWRVEDDQKISVSVGQPVQVFQVIASTVEAMSSTGLQCPENISDNLILRLLESREKTQRFTGVKLARLNRRIVHSNMIYELVHDLEEDVYVRLEGASYLVSVAGFGARDLFWPYISGTDRQGSLEAIIALGETQTREAVALISAILDDIGCPHYLRSAAAWCLAQSHEEEAWERLIRAFSDVQHTIREEALEGLIALGGAAIPKLLSGLENSNSNQVAGCAEALRQLRPLAPETLLEITRKLDSQNAPWIVWILGHLPREQVASSIAHLQESNPHLQFAMSILWGFVESWVAENWELSARSELQDR